VGLLRSALAVVGLTSAAHARALSLRVDAADRRAGELKEALAEARADAARWKTKASELGERLAKLEDAAERLPRLEREMQQWKTRDEKHVAQLAEVRERMERAERAVALSREHLMATETKLDIIEGAVNVLDTRTRRVQESSAPEPAGAAPTRR
jgi:predicted  nucleic acid-binding Zn-ribbon protein